jgi:thioredoxin reductase (NADPH)
MDYDLIIVGAGAAGMTAGIYASRYQLKNVIIGDLVGGLTTEAHKIYNWPGDPGISGFELTKKMADHVRQSEGEIISDVVIDIEQQPDASFIITTKGGKSFTAKRILFTSGTKHRKLNVPREDELLGKGVAYCATCDGPFFKGRDVIMVGGGNSVISAALYLADVAAKVYVVCRGAALKGEPVWRDELIKRSNVSVLYETNIIGFVGQDKLEAVTLDKPFLDSTELKADGLFVEIGLIPQSELFKKLGGEVDQFGYIKVKPDMSTNLKNVYAAGDSTDASNNFHQIVTACSEGAVAADAIYKSLSVN